MTKFELFEELIKHCFKSLIYLLELKVKGVNGKVKSSKFIVIKAGYPNLLHGYDFLGYDLMNS